MARSKLNDWTKQENLIRIQGWARDGLTMEQIASNIGISKPTLYKWEKKNINIFNALKIGKDTADRQVENALFKSAVGYEYKEEQVTNDGRVVETKKYAKPNTTAQIFWLKNRKVNEWRDKRDLSHEGQIDQSINMGNLSDEDLRSLANLNKE